MKLPTVIANLLEGTLHLVAPKQCLICGQTLTVREKAVCLTCLTQLPRTNLHTQQFSELHKSLGPTLPVDRICSWFWYMRGKPQTRLILEGKFGGKPYVFTECTRLYVRELQNMGVDLTQLADVVVPTPMYWLKRLMRGYNQSKVMAEAVSRLTGLPMVDALRARHSHGHQARLKFEQRARNIVGTLSLRRGVRIQGCRVLLVDDIVTTGATLTECIGLLKQAGVSRVSILTLGAARLK